MELRDAKINDVQGMGYANITMSRNKKGCSGIFNTVNPAHVAMLFSSDSLIFTGTIFDSGKEGIYSFPIMINKTMNNQISFVATGNPYSN